MGFEPDYATPPGETVSEWLGEHHMAQSELARRMDVSEKMLSQLITGAAPLTRATATKLQMVTGIPSKTWNSLESNYQDVRSRLAQEESLTTELPWFETLPVKQLRSIGVITANKNDIVGQIREVLQFFGVSDSKAWNRLWLEGGGSSAAFRKSAAFKADPAAVACWLRRGELEAEKQPAVPFNPKGLKESLPELRELTREPNPAQFEPSLKAITSRHGVAAVLIPEVVGSRCSGAAYWHHDRPVVQLSLRYKSDDHLWFTFFHELGHILLHGKREAFITDGRAVDSSLAKREEEADKFASRVLIPLEYEAELLELKSLNRIAAYAGKVGISPGIVVGRLQRESIIGYNVGNGLKKRYEFANL